MIDGEHNSTEPAAPFGRHQRFQWPTPHPGGYKVFNPLADRSSATGRGVTSFFTTKTQRCSFSSDERIRPRGVKLTT